MPIKYPGYLRHAFHEFVLTLRKRVLERLQTTVREAMEDGTLQHAEDSLIASENATQSQVEARYAEQRNARVTRSGTDVSPPATAAVQGRDPENGGSDGHNSPLFVTSSSSTPAKSARDETSNGSTRCECGIAVVVPPVERRWEYRVFPDEPRVSEIIQELDGAEELQYFVAFDDGHEEKVFRP